MDRSALIGVTAVATVAQLVVVLIGHFVPFIADLFAVIGVAISLAAGLLYARRAPGARPVAGGILAGGISAVLGIVVSVVLGDVPAIIILLGGLGGAGGGALGAVLAGLIFSARSRRASPKV